MADAPMTVVETAPFLKDAKPMMPDSEREGLVVFVGANREAAEIIPETPDAPTRVLAVIAKHPEAVEDVLRKAS